MSPVGCHGICTGYGAQCYGTFVSTFIAHYTYTLYRQQDYTCLPYLVIQGCFVAIGIFGLPVAEALDEDVIGILQNTYLLAGDIAQDTYSQTRTRERMTGNQVPAYPVHDLRGVPRP